MLHIYPFDSSLRLLACLVASRPHTTSPWQPHAKYKVIKWYGTLEDGGGGGRAG